MIDETFVLLTHPALTFPPYPVLKTSANFRYATFIKMGNGNRSMRFGNLTIASDCSPGRGDRKPGWKKARQNEMKCIIILFFYFF